MALLGDDTRDIGAYAAARVTRPQLTALRDRITVTPSDILEGGVAEATVTLAAGGRITARNDCYLPLHDLPRQRVLLETKFASLAVPVLGAERAERLRAAVLDIDRQPSVHTLLAATVR